MVSAWYFSEVCDVFSDVRDGAASEMECAERLAALVDWQPIEAAPRDGTMVLLAIEPVDEGYLLGWNPSRKISVVIGWWGYSEWTSHLMEEGTADTEGYSSPYQISIHPTHWMPLPSPASAKCLSARTRRIA